MHEVEMATTPPMKTEKLGFQSLVIGLLRDLRILFQQEMALARHEVQYEIGKIFKTIVWFAIAAILAVVAIFGAAAACVMILIEYTQLPAWACAVVISVTFLGGAWALVASGWKMAKSIHVTPVRTVRTLMDNARWVAEWLRARYT